MEFPQLQFGEQVADVLVMLVRSCGSSTRSFLSDGGFRCILRHFSHSVRMDVSAHFSALGDEEFFVVEGSGWRGRQESDSQVFCHINSLHAPRCHIDKSIVMGFSIPLGMLVAKWVPTPCCNDAYSVGSPKWTLWGKGWQRHRETTFSPRIGRFFLVSKRTFLFFWGVICWMLHIGRARHPGPGPRDIIPGQLTE